MLCDGTTVLFYVTTVLCGGTTVLCVDTVLCDGTTMLCLCHHCVMWWHYCVVC